MDDEMQHRLEDVLAHRDLLGRHGQRFRHPNRNIPTPGQLRVINAISHGLRQTEAATVLGISRHTARQHVKQAKIRVAAKTTPQLVAICLRRGWIT